MDSGTSAAATPKKAAVKRTNVTPWSAAIMGSKASSSMATAPGASVASSSTHADKTCPLPARIVSDVPLPSTEPLQQNPSNGMAGSAKIRALQEKWEKDQAQKVPSPSSTGSVEAPNSPSLPTNGSRAPVGPTPPVTNSSATPRQPPPVVSPVPIPSYAFSHKRSSTAMSGTPEAPSSKRQQVDHANAGASARSGTPKATVSAKSQPTTETAAPQTLSQSMKPQPPAETSEILTPAGTSFYQPWRPPSTQNTLSLTPTDGRVTPQGQGRKDVEVGSTNATIIKRVDGRRYVEYKAPGGGITTAYGALIPRGYSLLDTEQFRFICPVRTCRRRVETLRALGGHFNAAHTATAYNDNGDGTLSKVSLYRRDKLKYAPAVIISKNPLPPDAPPPVEPTFSVTNKIRTSRPSLPQRTTSPEPIIPPGPLGFLIPHDDSDAVPYLHGFLSQKQTTPWREDIQYLEFLPRRRDLPDSWLKYHQGETLDTNHYTCALAYIVGDEIRGAGRCTHVDTSKNKSLLRLSERCIKLPTAMPSSAKEHFSRIHTCVGCRYFSHLRKAANPCDWDPHRRRRAHQEFLTPPGPKKADDLGNGLSGVMEAQELLDLGPLPRSGLRGRKSNSPVVPNGTSPVPSKQVDGGSVEGLRGRKSNLSVVSNGSSPVPSEQVDSEDMEMEDWEFAPGKKLEKTQRETIAFSASYLTSLQPIVVADDISINHIRISPGGTQHWPADEGKLRYCEVIQGKVQLKSGGQSFAVGQGGVFVMRPGMTCTAENRQYTEAVLSCHTNSNYSFMSEGA